LELTSNIFGDLSNLYLTGFGIIYLILFLFKSQKKYPDFIENAFTLIPFFGIIYFLFVFNFSAFGSFFADFFNVYSSNHNLFLSIKFIFDSMITYTFLVGFLNLAILIVSQFFWLKKYKNHQFLIFLIVFLCLIPFDAIIIFMSIYSEANIMSFTILLVSLIGYILSFILITYLFGLLRNKLLKNKL
jgi:hypothetical protein